MGVGEGSRLHVVVATRAVAPQHGFGGLERAAADHLRALARRGVRLTVFTQPPHPDAPPPDEFDGRVAWREIPYRRFDLPLRRNAIPDRLLHYPAFSRALGRAVAALAREGRVDVVHAHGLAGAGYAGELQGAGEREKRAGREPAGEPSPVPHSASRLPRPLPPLVLNPHGLEEFGARSRAKWLAYAPFRRGLRAAAREAAAVVATDRALAAAIERGLGVPGRRIVTIPNGVDVAALDALVEPVIVRAMAGRYGLGRATLTLASVARLEPNKGLDGALAALRGLGGALPEGWRWIIVGRGSEEARLRALIGEYGLADRVTLAGALPDRETHALLERADLFLAPSRYEGRSLATLEAMTRRTPVVATAVGGLPDKVLPGRTGFLAAPDDPAGLRAALAAALAARADWAGYGARARALVEAEFDWAALAGRYLDLYRSLAGRP